MNLINNMEIATNGIKANKMRSILTMLGIIIGISAVIIMISVGQGATRQVSDRISSMGSNLLTVSPGAGQGGLVRGAAGSVNTLTVADSEAIKGLANVAYVAPELGGSATFAYANRTWTTQYNGTTPEYQFIQDWPAESGSFFSWDDVDSATPVVVLGKTVAANLFPDGSDPVGANIRINRISFTVVGVLSSKSSGLGGQDQDDAALIPVTTAQRRLMGVNYVRSINVQAASIESMSAVQTSIEQLLRERHRLTGATESDFNIRNMAELLETVESTTAILTLFLASVAAISLVVGGIGIMNIMLVSVTERTREIGLRMAVGATEGDIRNQFLVEALTLCLAGGIIGILVGFLGSKLIANLAAWPTTVTLNSVLLSAGFSLTIGLFFGYYPAKKAASLDPIEALRFER